MSETLRIRPLGIFYFVLVCFTLFPGFFNFVFNVVLTLFKFVSTLFPIASV